MLAASNINLVRSIGDFGRQITCYDDEERTVFPEKAYPGTQASDPISCNNLTCSLASPSWDVLPHGSVSRPEEKRDVAVWWGRMTRPGKARDRTSGGGGSFQLEKEQVNKPMS